MKKALVCSMALLACVCAARAESAFAWDFTKGVPPGGRARKGAVLGANGLVPAQIAKREGSPTGVEFAAAQLPEAFELEVEFMPRGDWTNAADRAASAPGNRQHMIWDSMAVNYPPKCRNRGMQLMFNEYRGRWTARLYAGLGDITSVVDGPSFLPAKGQKCRLTMRFDSTGNVFWDLDGTRTVSILDKMGPIVPDSAYRPLIGDRITSYYAPFDGYIRKVSLRPIARGLFTVRPQGRLAFERGEREAPLRLSVTYCGKENLADAVVSVEQCGPAAEQCVYARTEKSCGTLAPGEATPVELKVETRLAPGTFPVVVALTGKVPVQGTVKATNVLDMAIGPTFADRMPAVMWGSGGSDKVVSEFGFTHVLRYFGLTRPECSPAQAHKLNDTYDRALAAGMRAMHSVQVQYPDDDRTRFYRCLRNGQQPASKHEADQPEVSNPELVDYARRIAALDGARFGSHPGFGGVLPVSENRDHTYPSFRTEHRRYRTEKGRDVPEEVVRKTYSLAAALKRFPDGVVPVDDPLYVYYSWFWGGGDGWPGYTGAIAGEYRKVAGRYGDGSEAQRRRPFFSFWDPAVRCPPKWGSGGDVDVLSQWVYAQPEPMNVAGPAEEILAMAAGRPGQLPMIMTQLICYRSRLAPTNVVVSPVPAWAKRLPDAAFPTIPADALQEAVWSMIAKPVKGIMFHGWGTIFDTGETKRYCYTSPETATRLRHLLKDVVAPLGPTLKDLGRVTPEVAVLESFATAVFGGPASWGWLSPAITFMQRARLDPRVVYEETILRDGLAGTKVLYAPQCQLLSAPVVERIKAFQRAGGILVADGKLLPALKADVTVPEVAYGQPPKSDHTEDVDAATQTRVNTVARRFTENMKSTMLTNADALRRTLAARHAFTPRADSSTPEIVVYSRQWRDTPYVVAVNDRRTFGDYVGQWGLTMDKGLPCEGKVYLADPNRRIGAVYELSRGGEVPFTRTADGRIEVPLAYGTNDGRLLAFLERKIAAVDVAVAPARRPSWWSFRKRPMVARGGELAVTMTVRDAAGKPVQARLPVEVRVYDAAGKELDGAGYACAVDGVCTLKIVTNLNDAPGGYRVVCRDRASGLSRTVMVGQTSGRETR